MPEPAPQEVFVALEGKYPVAPDQPGYLTYWDELADEDPINASNRRFVTNLAQVALRGQEGFLYEVDRQKPKETLACEWYQALGPLNDMEGIEYDLIRAAELTYEPQARKPKVRETIRFENVNMLMELARLTDDPYVRVNAWQLALRNADLLSRPENPLADDPSAKLEIIMLQGDLHHDFLRQQHTGSLLPHSVPVEKYRPYENSFREQEISTIESVLALLPGDKDRDEDATPHNLSVGKLFELYFITERRYMAWHDERIDTTLVRGATSREDEAEMVGMKQAEIESDNFDIYVNNGGQESRFQLTTKPDKRRRYNKKWITEINVAQVLGNGKEKSLKNSQIVQRIKDRMQAIRMGYITT